MSSRSPVHGERRVLHKKRFALHQLEGYGLGEVSEKLKSQSPTNLECQQNGERSDKNSLFLLGRGLRQGRFD